MLATIRAEGSLLYAFRFTKSLAWLVGEWLAYGANKPTTRQTSHANDFVNAKSRAREKAAPLGKRLREYASN